MWTKLRVHKVKFTFYSYICDSVAPISWQFFPTFLTSQKPRNASCGVCAFCNHRKSCHIVFWRHDRHAITCSPIYFQRNLCSFQFFSEKFWQFLPSNGEKIAILRQFKFSALQLVSCRRMCQSSRLTGEACVHTLMYSMYIHTYGFNCLCVHKFVKNRLKEEAVAANSLSCHLS